MYLLLTLLEIQNDKLFIKWSIGDALTTSTPIEASFFDNCKDKQSKMPKKINIISYIASSFW